MIKHIRKKIFRRKCPLCHRWIYPELGIFKNARFGIGFVSYVISKRIRRTMSYEEIINDMRHIFGNELLLSGVAIIDRFKKFEAQIKAVYKQLEELIKLESFTHIDETGLPMMGENWWLWVICTANLVLYRQSAGRGHKSIEDIIKGFKGTIISDFFRAYEKLLEGLKPIHAIRIKLSPKSKILWKITDPNGISSKLIKKLGFKSLIQ
ncbi:MAG: IS66 family transposase [Promethearchaeota archaeon]